MIQLKDVSASIGGTSLFQGLNFSLQLGVSYLVDGKNGAGKTTFLKLLAGRIQPKSGSITYNFIGAALSWVEKYALRRKFIHFIPAHTLHELIPRQKLFYQQRYYSIEDNPFPTTVRDYLGEHLTNLKQLQLPASFKLQHVLDIDLIRLSNGQVKKIIIIKQLLDAIPKILLLDYPFEGLDAQSRKDLSQFLDHLADTHHIQLMIADHEHEQLPKAITHRIQFTKTGIHITKRAFSPILENNPYESINDLKERTPVVDMRDVTIQYGDHVIIDKLNWMIRSGERWALTGPNGSGKTTLFSMIYADNPMAYSQQVFLFGKRRGSGESIWDIKKRISYLGPEQIHFLDYTTAQLTVRDYLHKVKAVTEKTDHVIRQFNVTSLLPMRLQELSHGELQLVLLISLFLAPNELLLLDEPFQYLDPEQKNRVTTYLHSFLEPNTTLVLITHHEDDVRQWTHLRLSL